MIVIYRSGEEPSDLLVKKVSCIFEYEVCSKKLRIQEKKEEVIVTCPKYGKKFRVKNGKRT
jgi:nitrite reductase/ring-hydroxylating ferredoxin subunit